MAEKQTYINEKLLEELYELLSLYFKISPHGGLVKTLQNGNLVEPALDWIEMREAVYARITSLMVGGD